jgi:hypothetical protein
VLTTAVKNHSAELVKGTVTFTSVLMMTIAPGRIRALTSGSGRADPVGKWMEEETQNASSMEGTHEDTAACGDQRVSVREQRVHAFEPHRLKRCDRNTRLLEVFDNPRVRVAQPRHFTKADGMEAGPRRWHRDAEDRRMLKIALYLNDVDEDGGPLQVLRRQLPDHDRMVRGKFPILSQEKLETALGDFDPDRDVVTCTGKAGTVIFADTAALYHRGKPASARDRCAIFFKYMNRAPLRPFRCERSTIPRAQTRRLAASRPATMSWSRSSQARNT